MSALRFSPLFDKSWAAVKNNLPLIAALSLVYGVATAVMYRIPFLGHFASGLMSPGYLICLMKLKDKQDISMQDFFWSFLDLNRFLQLVILNIVIGFLVIAGFICLIIPGIYVSVCLGFASTYFVIRNPDAIESIKASFRLVKDRWWEVAGFLFMLALLNLAGAISLLIGLLVTIPMSALMLVFAIEELDVVTSPVSSPVSPSVGRPLQGENPNVD